MGKCAKEYEKWMAEERAKGHCPTSRGGWWAAWIYHRAEVKKLRKMATKYNPRYVNGLENSVNNLEDEIERLQKEIDSG